MFGRLGLRFFSLPVWGKNTIFALATAQGKAGVGIIRVSGPATREVLARLLPEETASRITRQPRKLFRVDLIGHLKEILDTAMVVFFANPHSFTGEDVAELHIHSSKAVISALYAQLSSFEGVRIAEPGEFSRRAFLNSKLDLTQVEGLGDLLAAETDNQRRLALTHLGGRTGAVFTAWRTQIIQAMAMVEAWIDFSEDEAIEADTLLRVRTLVEELRKEIEGQLEQMKYSEIIRHGLQVVLCGPPNAGKSSLLNMLIQRDAAIVSPIAGTTRDVLQVNLQAEGHSLTVWDTAGIRETQHTCDPIEREGIRRALHATSTADFVLFLIDASSLGQIETWRPPLQQLDANKLAIVLNKTDLSPTTNLHQAITRLRELLPTQYVTVPILTNSVVSGTSNFKHEMLALLYSKCLSDYTTASALPVIVNERQQSHARAAHAALMNVGGTLDNDVVLAAEHLRQAANAIGRITGHIGNEDILDVLFASFCIGK